MVKNHKELKAYIIAYNASMKIFKLSKQFPKDELYSLTDQIRRSSRSVCSNIAEAWRFRKYSKSFKFKLTISEGEAAETQTWLDYCLDCQYISKDDHQELNNCYNQVLSLLVSMRINYKLWRD